MLWLAWIWLLEPWPMIQSQRSVQTYTKYISRHVITMKHPTTLSTRFLSERFHPYGISRPIFTGSPPKSARYRLINGIGYIMERLTTRSCVVSPWGSQSKLKGCKSLLQGPTNCEGVKPALGLPVNPSPILRLHLKGYSSYENHIKSVHWVKEPRHKRSNQYATSAITRWYTGDTRFSRDNRITWLSAVVGHFLGI